MQVNKCFGNSGAFSGSWERGVMNLFDIVGPIMVGPSSSHTAGAVKIGLIAGKLLGERPEEADSLLRRKALS